MKRNILILIGFLYSILSFGQGNTKITIKIPQGETEKLEAQIFVENPMLPINTGFHQDTLEIKNGQCQFLFDIKNVSFVSLTLNEKYITFPGVYTILVEPGDDLLFELPPLTKAKGYGFGINNIKISGKGIEKVNLTKNIVGNLLKIFLKDLPYEEQSLTYKYETTDQKLNVVDSVYRINKTVNKHIKNLIKAQLYGDLMVSLFRSSLRSDNDSLRHLLKKYIINKKRMEILYEKDVIKYSGTGNLASFLILSAYKNPTKLGGEDFSERHKIEYAKLINRGLKDHPQVRDFLLSKFLINTTLSGFDSTTTMLYKFYVDHVDFNNPNYTNVVHTYQETESKFAMGKPFYNFSLPDSAGRMFSLSDFKGKVLVIDFWFNGCGGCKLMVPALNEAEKQMEGANVEFISIGIDKREWWLKGIGKYSSPNSLQLYTDEQADKHPMMQYLNIHSYPRLIIVDKDGKILPAPPDPRSNSKQFVRVIQSYL